MLNNKVTIKDQDYQIRQGTYVKRKIAPTIPRFGTGDLALSDLSRWNHWGQSIWAGGFQQEIMSEQVPTKFNKSENIDVFRKVGKLMLAKSLDVTADMSGITDSVMDKYFEDGAFGLFFSGSNAAKILWRFTGTAVQAEYTDASAMVVNAIKEISMKNKTALLLSTNSSSSGEQLKEWVATDTVADITAWPATWTPTNIVRVGEKVYLLGSGLYSWDLDAVFTQHVADNQLDLTGTKNQNACEVLGKLYYIGFKTSQGKLWVHNPTADTETIVYDFGSTLEPEFCFPFNNKVVIGGQDTDTQKPSFWEYDPLSGTIINILKFAPEADEDDLLGAFVYNGLMQILINGSGFNYVYNYDGVNWSNFIKESSSGVGNYQSGGTINNRMAIISNDIVHYSGNLDSFQASGALDSSKIDFGLFGVDKLIGGITIYHESLAANQSVVLKGKIDDETVFSAKTALGYNATVDSTSFDVELLSNNIGKKLEYQIGLKGSEGATDSPEVLDVVVRYLLLPTPKSEWFFDLLLIDDIEGGRGQATSEQLASKIEDAFGDTLINFKDIDGKFFSADKAGTADRGVIFDNLELLGPFNNGEQVEYVARVHLIEG
tara:strand:- start:4962 stop:6767 length:1806 start_codon:yes stop_codon:yes gene_type:complete